MRLEHLLSGAFSKGISCSHSKTQQLAEGVAERNRKLHVAIFEVASFIDIIEDEIDITTNNRRSLYYEESK